MSGKGKGKDWQWAELRRDFMAGATVPFLAAKYGFGLETVYSHLIRRNMVVNRKRLLSESEFRALGRRRLAGENIADLADECGYTSQHLGQQLSKRGYPKPGMIKREVEPPKPESPPKPELSLAELFALPGCFWKLRPVEGKDISAVRLPPALYDYWNRSFACGKCASSLSCDGKGRITGYCYEDVRLT